MSDDAFDLDIDDIKRRMAGALTSLRQEFASLRTGRASAAMLDSITVEAYGARLPLNQCSSVNVPDPRMISVTVWDKDLVESVVKAIQDSGLGINPVVEGTVIRLPIPELNEERRSELANVASRLAEGARVAVRNVRRNGLDVLRKAKADGMSDDEIKLWTDEIQEITDQAITDIGEALETKKSEIMHV